MRPVPSLVCRISAIAFATAVPVASAQAAEYAAPDVFDWTGFYVGAHVGGVWLDDDESSILCNNPSEFEIQGGPSSGETAAFCQLEQQPGDTDPGPDFIAFTGDTTFGDDKDGILGGFHAGYNAQVDSIVVGPRSRHILSRSRR